MTAYTKGLHELGNGVYGYLQPDGSWGLSNAGLVVDGSDSLLVDTLFDPPSTRAMLDTMKRATSAIDFLVNTHANGDHCWGNSLVEGAEIIASDACAEEMSWLNPDALAALVGNASELGRLGAFAARIFSRFDFSGAELRLPTKTFEGELELGVGSKTVRLIEVGPAHTSGDVLIHVPEERVVFAGDIVMSGHHPIAWSGQIRNYERALDRVLELDVDVVMPGHGPVTDKSAAQRIKDFLEHLTIETRKRHEAGMTVLEAARDIPLEDYADWGEPERIAVNVAGVYRELSGGPAQSPIELTTLMAEFAAG